MKKSRQVALVLITTVSLAACSKKQDETTRDLTVHGWTNSQDTISTVYRPYYHYGMGYLPFFIFHNSFASPYRSGGYYGPEVSRFRSSSHAFSGGHTSSRTSAISSRGGFGGSSRGIGS